MESFYDTVEADIHQTHIIVNAKAGHGKSHAVKSIIAELKRRDPNLIVKVFDVSFAWFDSAPLPYHQRITTENWVNAFNQDNCVYEMGDLTEDTRRLFVSFIVKQDYTVRRKIRELYGEEGLKRMPFIVYVFEESDTYFDSTSLNKKDDASATLRDFIKVGRNFKLRAFCVATTCVGELGTKLRRRSEHLIGRVISDGDQRMYNRKHKGEGLGDRAVRLERFQWMYCNGEKVIDLVTFPYRLFDPPKEYVPNLDVSIVNAEVVLEKHAEEKRVNPLRRFLFWGIMVALVIVFLLYR